MINSNNFIEKKKYSIVINAVVANKEGKILLIQRGLQEEHGPGTWSVPGGKLEFEGIVYEALQKTATKEVLEEVGIEIEDEMHLIANNTFQHNEDALQVIAIVFLCHYKSGEPKPSEEATVVRWIGPEEIEEFEFHNINVKNYVLKGFKFLKSNK
ncbi:MAG: NUDIX domain-containing protein [bacterium]|nr:NUDIX domain-containing protein [bacterium]